MANATIYDVSKLANVSIATVSRVLNQPERVSDKTRARVISAIDELNFMPKTEAVARARKTLGRIGILTPFLIHDSFYDRLRGLIGAISKLAYEPVIYEVALEAHRDGFLTSLPATRRVDGLIAVDIRIDEKVADRLLKHKLPTVQIVPSSLMTSDDRLTTILHDDEQGGHMAATYFLEKGYKRFACIGDRGVQEFLGTFKDRKLDGFRQTLALNGVALPDSYVRLPWFGMEPAYQAMQSILDLPDLPEAIFVTSDTQAIGAMRAIRERGLGVQTDIAVMGFDNIAVSEYIGLTTIDQQLEESGRLAVELLIKQIEEGAQSAQKINLPFTLIPRETA